MMRQLTADKKAKVKEKPEKVKKKREIEEKKKKKEEVKAKNKDVKDKSDAAPLNNLNKKPAKKVSSNNKPKRKRSEFLASENSGIKLLYIHHDENSLPKKVAGEEAPRERLSRREENVGLSKQREVRPRKPNVAKFGSSNSLSYESSPYSSPSPASTPTRGRNERRNKRQQKYVIQGDSSDSSPNSTIQRGRHKSSFYLLNDLHFSRSSFSSTDSSTCNQKVVPGAKRFSNTATFTRSPEKPPAPQERIVPKSKSEVRTSNVQNYPPRIIYTENDSNRSPKKKDVPKEKKRTRKDSKDERASRWSVGDSGIDLFNLDGSALSTVSSTASGSYLFDSTTSFSSYSPCCSPEEKYLGVFTIQNPIYEDQRSFRRSEIIKTANYSQTGQEEKTQFADEVEDNGSGDIYTLPVETKSRTKDFIYNYTSFTIHEEEDGDGGAVGAEKTPTSQPPPPTLPNQTLNDHPPPPANSPPDLATDSKTKAPESDSDTPPPLPKNPPPYSSRDTAPPPPPPPPHFPPPNYEPPLPETYSSPYFAKGGTGLQGFSSSLDSAIAHKTSGQKTPPPPSSNHGPSESLAEGPPPKVSIPKVAMLSDYDVIGRPREAEPKVKFYMRGEGKIGDAHNGPVKSFEILILDDQVDVESTADNWILRRSPYDKMSPASTLTSPPTLSKKAEKAKGKKAKSGTLTRVKNSLENLLQSQSSKAKQDDTGTDAQQHRKEEPGNDKDISNKNDVENGTYRLRGKDISRPFPLVRISPPDSHVDSRRRQDDSPSISSESMVPPWESCEVNKEQTTGRTTPQKPTTHSTPVRRRASASSSDMRPNLKEKGERKSEKKVGSFRRELPKESHYIIEAPPQRTKLPIPQVAQHDALKLLNDNLAKVNPNDKSRRRPDPSEGKKVNDLRKYFSSRTSDYPKPRKGILKKEKEGNSSAPPVPKKKAPRKNSVTYRLPPPPSPNTAARQVEAEVDNFFKFDSDLKNRILPPPLPPKGSDDRPPELKSWRAKYEILLGIVREPSRLLPESLAKELQMVEAKRQGYAIERALVQANIDTFETMGGNKDRRLRGTRPESIRSLYEQVANLDCMLTSLETQIDVLSSVNHNLPKEFHDTFHDSGTSGHEPDSLEAIQTVVSGDMVEGGRLRPPSPPDGDAEEGGGGGGGGGDGGGGRPSESAVLLHLERCAHRQTRRCLQEMKERYEALQQQLNERAIKVDHTVRSVGSALESLHIEHESTLNSLESLNSVNSNDRLVDELKLREMTISQLRTRVLQLEKDRLDKVPLDAAKEINRLNNNMIQLEKQRDELTLHNFTLKSQLSEVANKIHDPAATFQVNKDPSLVFRENGSLQNGKGKDADDPDVVKVLRKATYKVTGDTAKLKQMCSEFDAKEEEYKKRIGELETELKNLQNESNKNHDRTVREMENRMELASQKLEAAERYMAGKEEECNMLKLDIDTLNEENKRLKENLNEMMLKQQNYEEVLTEKKTLGDQYSRMVEEHRVLSEDFNRERVLRKKYYNQVEEMKGKIRVYCRVRPLSDSERRRGSEGGSDLVVGAEDEFSVSLNTTRGGHRSFLFDRVFQPLEDQQAVFQDTHALVQSALDGFNVTIMAYGQTGSGKTYTMLGTESEPGIAPRAFSRLFHLLDEGRARQEVSVSTYMLELYNDKLIDLLKPATLGGETDRLDIKRDKKGIVHVQGATLRSVSSANELSKAFNDGLANRHTAATKMNVESSRSHLLIAVCLTITSKQTGSVLRGKLTLVDLAGSERVSKSGASSDQLKEANSINKSLSALGDVISALSSESSFVPYRNSKLTMLLQDSLGGNAKTLVFVNVSPAAYNADETLVSLMYATRIKQITNSVCKNADNKEIMRLKSIINKLRKGEDIEEEVVI